MLKAKDFRKCYKSLIKLYGAIISDDIFKILKHYYPDLKKRDLNADLKTRCDKSTRGYVVYRTNDRKYLLTNDMMTFPMVDALFQKQEGKSFYIPDTLKEFLAYGDFDEWLNNLDDIHQEVKEKLESILSEEDIIKFLFMCGTNTEYTKDSPLDSFKEDMDFMEIKYNAEDEDFLVFCYNLLLINTRYPVHKGHTPLEMFVLSGKEEFEQFVDGMIDQIRNGIYNGDINPQKLLENVDDLEMDEISKETIRDELREIITDLDRYKA